MAERPSTAGVVPGQIARVFGRDSLYMVIWALQLLFAACLTPVITRVVGVAEFGVVASSIAVMEVLFVLSGLGLDIALQRQFAGVNGTAGARKLLAVAIVLAGVFTALASSTVGWWAAPLHLVGHESALRLAVVWAGLCAMTGSALALLRSQDRLAAFVTVSLMQSVVAEAASLLLVIGHAPTATSFLQGRVFAQLGAIIVALALGPPAMWAKSDWPMVTNALRYALPLVPSSLGAFILTTADRLIIQGAMGNVAVARYQVAYNIAAVPILLLSVLQSVWLPRFFATDGRHDRHALMVATKQMLYRLMVPSVAGFAVGAPLILRIWAPSTYEPDKLSWVVSIVVVTAVPFAAQALLSMQLTTEGRTGTMAMATAVAAISNVVLNIVLIPAFGLGGSATATLLAYALLYAVLYVSLRGRGSGTAAGRGVRLNMAAACLVAVGSAAMPVGGHATAVRFATVVACLAWFTALLLPLLRISRTPGRARPHGLVGKTPTATWERTTSQSTPEGDRPMPDSASPSRGTAVE